MGYGDNRDPTQKSGKKDPCVVAVHPQVDEGMKGEDDRVWKQPR